MKAKVLIMAGGDISRKLPFVQAGCACPALIPVNTRPLASYVIELYRDTCDVHLFVDEQFVPAVLEELAPRKHHYHLHGIRPTRGVVESLAQALDATGTEGDIVVNLVTTIPREIPNNAEVQVTLLPAHSTQAWSAILPEERALRFFYKGEERPQEAMAFTGVFRLPGVVLKEATAVAARHKPNDLLSVVEAAHSRAGMPLRSVEWIDCGHETNFYESRAKLLTTRSFNTLRVDLRRGTITKSSRDQQKLALEAEYLDRLPSSLQVLFPRVISRSGTQPDLDSYEMEYYGYPNLAEYLLFWNLSQDNWWRCFDRLHSSLSLFREHPASIGRQCYRDFHWGKTIGRIEAYLGALPDAALRSRLERSPLRLNGRVLAPLSALLTQAEALLDQSYTESLFGIFHGDFCFNNILFDLTSGLLRFIDPRGSFGPRSPGIHGDRRYDLAKLAHSSIGHYDYIVNGLFDLAVEPEGHFQLRIGLRPQSAWLGEMTRWLVQQQGADAQEVATLTGLLFLSMCPLHAEDPERQLAFFLRGIELLHEAFS